MHCIVLTRKKSQVEPCKSVPYCTSVCIAKSSGELIGVTIRSTVRNAAKLAVYDEIRMSVKNHQAAPTMRPEMERGDMSQPCCIKAAKANQNEFKMLNSLTATLPDEPRPTLPATPPVLTTPIFAGLAVALVAPVIGPGTGTPPMMPGGCWLAIWSWCACESAGKEKT